MRLYFSGGSAIVETTIPDACVMVSFFSHTDGERPIARVRKLMEIRAAGRKLPPPAVLPRKKKGKGKS